jgi:hypothetical protein
VAFLRAGSRETSSKMVQVSKRSRGGGAGGGSADPRFHRPGDEQHQGGESKKAKTADAGEEQAELPEPAADLTVEVHIWWTAESSNPAR